MRGVPGLHWTTVQRMLVALDALPQRVADDAPFRRCDNSSLLLFCFHDGKGPSGIGVLAIRLASVGPTADVELIVENAGT